MLGDDPTDRFLAERRPGANAILRRRVRARFSLGCAELVGNLQIWNVGPAVNLGHDIRLGGILQVDAHAHSKRVITAYVEPALSSAAPEERFQFERHGYFVADVEDHRPGAPVFNRAVTLRDSWGKQTGPGSLPAAIAPR